METESILTGQLFKKIKLKTVQKIFLLVILCPFFSCGVKKPPKTPEKLFPHPITSLKAVIKDNCADLSWSYSGKELPAKFIILRLESMKENSGWSEPRQIAELDGKDSAFQDCSLEPGRFYGYRVIGVSRYNLRSDEGNIEIISLPAVPAQP